MNERKLRQILEARLWMRRNLWKVGLGLVALAALIAVAL